MSDTSAADVTADAHAHAHDLTDPTAGSACAVLENSGLRFDSEEVRAALVTVREQDGRLPTSETNAWRIVEAATVLASAIMFQQAQACPDVGTVTCVDRVLIEVERRVGAVSKSPLGQQTVEDWHDALAWLRHDEWYPGKPGRRSERPGDRHTGDSVDDRPVDLSVDRSGAESTVGGW